MVAEAGFKSEVHDVQTEDGYILTVHRILKKSKTKRLGPVFLMHPLLTTSSDYIRTGPEIALRNYFLQAHLKVSKCHFHSLSSVRERI